MSAKRRLVALVPAVAAAVVVLRKLAARSNTQVHRINQKRPSPRDPEQRP